MIGADLLYEERNGPALAALLPRILRPGAQALIADPRRPHADGLLTPLVAAGWAHDLREVRRHRTAGRIRARHPSPPADRAGRMIDPFESLPPESDKLANERSSVAQW